MEDFFFFFTRKFHILYFEELALVPENNNT